MKNQKLLKNLAIPSAVMLLIFFVGCGSTDSDDPPDNSSTFFNSGEMSSGDTFSYTFENEGTFEYYCQNHAPDMQGEVTVSSDVQTAAQDTIEMENLQFQPSQITVSPNTEIVWVNRDDAIHIVVSGNPTSDNGGGPDY